MEQHELRPPKGAKKQRKRVGRGNASGHGTYSGRGVKGQQSRSGYKTRPAFEGGQTPLVRRLPRRRGFRNPFRVAYTPVNLKELAKFPADSEVTPESLREVGVVRSLRQPIKILGDGDLTVALTVRTHRVSAAARAKIEGAGGAVEELTPRKSPEQKRKRGRTKKPEAVAAKAEDAPAEEETESEEKPTADAAGEEQDDSGSESSTGTD